MARGNTVDSDADLNNQGRRKLDEANMLYTVAVVLVILWALGLVTSFTLGGLIHVLLVVALIAIVLQLLGGRRVL